MILSALGFYAIPIMLYPFGIFVTWLLLSAMFDKENPNKNHFIKGLFISCVSTAILTVALYTPVFAVSGVRAVIANRFVTSLSWSAFVDGLPSSLRGVWFHWNRDIP